jgi:hypothetical protein
MNERTQFVQKVLGTRRLLLIGCGSGLSDPNLGPLLGWLRDELSGGHRNDYLLCLDRDAHDSGPFVRVPFGSHYSDLAKFLKELAPLGAEHQNVVDISLAYQALTKASHSENDVFSGQASDLIGKIGEYVCAHATPQLYDALEDEEANIGLALGLVKGICLAKSYDDLQRVTRVSHRIPHGINGTHARSHLVQAFVELCPHSRDSGSLRQVSEILTQWAIEEGPASKLAHRIQVTRHEIDGTILTINSGANS